MNLSYKKQADILRTFGIYPTTSQSVVIQNLFQSGAQAIISPNILQILGQYIQKETVIDAEILEP